MDAHSARTTIDDMAIPLLIDGGGYIIGGALGGLVKGIDSYRTHKALDNYIKCRRNTI